MKPLLNTELGARIASATLDRFIPEPKNRLGFSVKSLVGTGLNLLSGSNAFPGVQPEYVEMMNKQIEVQQQMQLVSLYSNIEKSKHETQMAAVRNIRAG